MIEAGEYVRTKNGKIDKVINNNCYMPQYIECEKSLLYKEDIVNNSKNIIDLIEVGDYVNGTEIDLLEKSENRVWSTSTYGDEDIVFYENEIKTILTKEQFEQNCYTVERKEE